MPPPLTSNLVRRKQPVPVGHPPAQPVDDEDAHPTVAWADCSPGHTVKNLFLASACPPDLQEWAGNAAPSKPVQMRMLLICVQCSWAALQDACDHGQCCRAAANDDEVKERRRREHVGVGRRWAGVWRVHDDEGPAWWWPAPLSASSLPAAPARRRGDHDWGGARDPRGYQHFGGCAHTRLPPRPHMRIHAERGRRPSVRPAPPHQRRLQPAITTLPRGLILCTRISPTWLSSPGLTHRCRVR